MKKKEQAVWQRRFWEHLIRSGYPIAFVGFRVAQPNLQILPKRGNEIGSRIWDKVGGGSD